MGIGMPARDCDLCSLVLRPRPGQGTVPFHGRHLHAAFLAWIAERDPLLASALHEPGRQRPFTVAVLPLPETLPTFAIRCTLLDRRLIGTVHDLLAAGTGELHLRLGTETHRLAPAPVEGWASATSWEDLAATPPPGRDIRLEFATPTCFSRDIPGERKRLALFPQPAWLWESWGQKWRLFGPPTAGLAGIGEAAERWLLASSYRLETRVLDLGRVRQKGFVGWTAYELQPGTPADVAQRLHMLAAFSFYAGTGYKTTMGLGQTRLLSRP
jgi:CRISPR-associated endoribonuclease Cas6